MNKPEFDLIIKNVRVVRPHGNVVHEADIAIKDGKVARVAPGIDVLRAKAVHDGKGRLAFPGAHRPPPNPLTHPVPPACCRGRHAAAARCR